MNIFLKKHPWLTQKMNFNLWKFANHFGDFSYVVNLGDPDMKIRVNSKDNSVAKEIVSGTYEFGTRLFISKFLTQGDKVVDIGANIGYFSLLFSKIVGDHGEVHVFEPSRREFLELCFNIGLNNAENVFLNHLAASNFSGYSIMSVFEKKRYGAYNSLVNVSHPAVKNARIRNEKIRTISLDDYFSVFTEIKPCLVKIDVEGFESQVINGMQDLLQTADAPCLVVEVCENTRLGGGKAATVQLPSLIESFGYKLFSPMNDGSLDVFEIGHSLNCVALKPSHLERLEGYEINLL